MKIGESSNLDTVAAAPGRARAPGRPRPAHPGAAAAYFDELRLFLTTVYYPGQVIRFFAELREPDKADLPDFLYGRELAYLNDKHERKYRNVLNAFSTHLDSCRFNSTIATLSAFNNLGYDIYVCPATLTSNTRWQRTAYEVRWVILEADHQSVEEQAAFYHRHKHRIGVAVWSGGRSLQMWFPIQPIRNPHCLTRWRDISEMRVARDRNTTCDLPQFDRVAEHYEELALAEGFKPDPAPLKNFITLIRCPGFKHAGTGNYARLIHPAVPQVDNKGVPVAFLQPPPNETPPQPAASAPSDATVVISNVEPKPRNPATDEAKPAATAVQPVQISLACQRNWLDDLWEWERLKRDGIPARYHRNDLHHAAFTVARLWDWPEGRLKDEWRRVVAVRPQNIGCTEDYAVEDIVRHWRAIRNQQPVFWLPRTAALPEVVPDWRVEHCAGRLATMGCRDAVSASRIIATVLYLAIRTCPQACLDGRAALQATKMKKVAVRHAYTPARDWLCTVGVMALTSRSYRVGERFMEYRISPHLVLWLLGFRTADLVWKLENTPGSDEAEEIAQVQVCCG